MSDSSSSSTYISKLLSPSSSSETRNWLDLPRDITATILQKLGTINILYNAQRVCKQWRSICNDPVMWRTIDMHHLYDYPNGLNLEIMCRHAINRSRGNLVDITLTGFGTDDLLIYITDSASQLQCLRLLCCYNISDEGLIEVAKKLPYLEELDITNCGKLSEDSLEAIGRCCPLLKSLKFNVQSFSHITMGDDEEVLAIAQTMPQLRHLQLFGNVITNDGLLAILDGCSRLESLDLRMCYNVDLGGSLRRRCAEQIKDFLEPDAPAYDYPFFSSFHYDDCRSLCSWSNDDNGNNEFLEHSDYEEYESDHEQNGWMLDQQSYPYI